MASFPNDIDMPPVHGDVPPVQGDGEGQEFIVEAEDFTALQNRTHVLETNFATLNTNLTQLSTLMNQLVQCLAGDTIGVGVSTSSPVDFSRPTEQTRSQDGVHLFKHMKPPIFCGEDKDRNKDSVMTFLQ